MPRLSRFISLLVVALVAALVPAASQERARSRTNERPAVTPGQSATQLSDGRWLLVGGFVDGSTDASIWVQNSVGLERRLLPIELSVPRAFHSATLTADGTVLVVGGRTADGTLTGVVERIDVEAPQVNVLAESRLTPRADHSGTLMTDGQVLVAGGTNANDTAIADAEIFSDATGEAHVAAGLLKVARAAHQAYLQADGRVLISQGIGTDRRPVRDAEAFEPETETFTAAPSSDGSIQAVGLAGSMPTDGAVDVARDVRIAMRFFTPVSHRTVTSVTVRLRSIQGPAVEARLVVAEEGRLVIVSPNTLLDPGRDYVVEVRNLVDQAGRRIGAIAVRFSTRREEPTTSDPLANAVTDGVNSTWRQLPALQAAAGVTALAGQVLRLNGSPLSDVTLKIDDRTTRTDRTGRFLLAPLEAGHHELVIDGRTANTPGVIYGVFEAGVDVIAGRTTALTYTSWMPRIDTANAITIPSPTTEQVVITTPAIPGLEVIIPPGTVIRDVDGAVSREVSITPIPVDQPPFPLPKDVYVPIYFTVQPGGGYVYTARGSGQGVRLYYPNYRQAPSGSFFDFWHYDPENRGWYVYGQGHVSVNQLQIIPDPGVQIYEFTGAMVASPSFAPPEGPCPCGDCDGGDPVDLSTGLFHLTKTDLSLPDFLPVRVARQYRTRDNWSRAFGVGSSIEYDMYIIGDRFPYTYADIVSACGSRIHFNRISAGTGFEDAVYEHTATSGRFFKARIVYSFFPRGWRMTLRDGSVFIFPESDANTPRAEYAALLEMRDRYGNSVKINRATSNIYGNLVGDIVSVVGSGGSRLDFTYASNRITQVRDNIGRTVNYQYDGSGRLWKVTDAAGGVTEYGYDGQGRMRTIIDPRGITYLTNFYDANSRVSQQVLADGGTYQFAYTVNAGQVTQTDLTDPRGVVRRVTYGTNGGWLTDTRAFGRAEQQSETVQRGVTGGQILSHTDALGRRTDFTYDANGNLATLTRLAGTSDAITTTLSYSPVFDQIASVTNGLNKTTIVERNYHGTAVGIITPLGHRTTFEENGRGQMVTMTDPFGTSQFEYDGSVLASTTNAMGATQRRIVDGAGRLRQTTDALGRSSGYEYSALDQPRRFIDPIGGVTEYQYDSNGNVTSVTDAKMGATGFGYDSMDRLETRTDPLTNVERYAYDLNGNVLQYTDRRGQIANYTYDGLNRLTQVMHADGSTTTYTYDAGDRITQVVASAGTLTLSWDGLNRLISETGPTGTVSYTYDAADRRSTMTVAGQPAVVYTYDDDDRLTQITQGTKITSFGYDAAGRRTTLTLPNGVAVDYAYDSAHQLTSLTYKLGPATLGTLTYIYDTNGRRISVGGSFARIRLPRPLSSATYNAANQLTQWDGAAFTYDLNGNLLSDGTRTFSWDAQDQLSAAGAATSATFQYDAFGRRLLTSIGSVSLQALYDESSVVQELVGGVPTAQILNGRGLDEVLTRTDIAGDRSVLTDGLGSTIALSDSAGALATQYTYDPFGTATSSGAVSFSPNQFTGREADSTGLYYYRARYYDSSHQRFLSEDPIGFSSGDANLYAYVRNDPTNWTDPSGEILGIAPWLIPPLVGALEGAGLDVAWQWLEKGSWDCLDLDLWRIVKSAGLGAALSALGPEGPIFGRVKYKASPNWPGQLNRGDPRTGWFWWEEKGRNFFGRHGGNKASGTDWHNAWFRGPREPHPIGAGVLGGAAGAGVVGGLSGRK